MAAEQVVRQHYQYFNNRRFDKAVDLIDPQAVFHTLPTRQRLMGVAGYRAMVFAWLHAFADGGSRSRH